VMQIISVFKRLDFAMDTVFMSELYHAVDCKGAAEKSFFLVSGSRVEKSDIMILCALYFPRMVYAVLAATPLYWCSQKHFHVPEVNDRASKQFDRLECLSHSHYTTLLSRKANNRLALTLLAEACSMASVTLEDMKYSAALHQYIRDHEKDKKIAVWFCLHDISNQLQRAILAIFLSGFMENCLQLNVQVLAMSMMYAQEQARGKRFALWVSIWSSIIICVLKFDQTRKVISYSFKMCRVLEQDLDAHHKPGQTCQSIEVMKNPKLRQQNFSMDELKRKIRRVRYNTLPLLIGVTFIFVAAVLWAAVWVLGMRGHFQCHDAQWNGVECVPLEPE